MSGCWKIAYANRQAATDAAALQTGTIRELGGTSKERRKVLIPYRCNSCNKFHLTKQRPRREGH